MAYAVIQSETHTNKGDMQDLLDVDLSDFDAVCLEGGGEAEVFQRPITLGYSFFVAGVLFLDLAARYIYTDRSRFRERLETEDVEKYHVDASLPEIYEAVKPWKRVFLAVLAGIAALGIVGFANLVFVSLWATIGFGEEAYLFGGLVSVFLFSFLTGLMYLGLIIWETNSVRDDIMSENILKAADEGNEKILVNCGEFHKRGISSRLEKEGWTVRRQPTSSIVGKLMIFIHQTVAAPLRIIKQVR